MGALIGLFCIMAVVGSAIAIWLNTKFGKKWLESLNLCIRHLFETYFKGGEFIFVAFFIT